MPPPVAHSLPLPSRPSFHTVSLAKLDPLVYSVVPPMASTCGDDAGHDTL